MLSDFAAGTLPGEAAEAVQQHLEACSACREVQKNLELLSIASVSGEEPPESFDRQLHMRLAQAAGSAASAGRLAGQWWRRPSLAAAAVAVAFVLGIAIGSGLMQTRNNQSNMDAAAMALVTRATVETGKPVTVRLVFTSDEDISDVAFDIELEPGLEFATTDSEIAAMKVLQWDGDLKRGRNEIPFAVTVAKPGRWVVTARAQYHDATHEHRIVLLTQRESQNNVHIP
jgi:hypothetical protein